MKAVTRQERESEERVDAIDDRVSGIRAKSFVSETDATHASMLRVWLLYNTRAPRYVRAALEREIGRLRQDR